MEEVIEVKAARALGMDGNADDLGHTVHQIVHLFRVTDKEGRGESR